MASFRDLDAFLTRRRGHARLAERHPVVAIDDDTSIRESLRLHLGDRYQLTLCASAREGVNAVDEETCAVILDVKMPGEDGFWACTEIRKKVLDVPVIFYSAYQNLKNPYAIINEHRPFGYVDKGDDIQKLVQMVDTAVKLQAMIVANRKLIQNLEKANSRAR
jgi:DNA-binding NtrC family response regulator